MLKVPKLQLQGPKTVPQMQEAQDCQGRHRQTRAHVQTRRREGCHEVHQEQAKENQQGQESQGSQGNARAASQPGPAGPRLQGAQPQRAHPADQEDVQGESWRLAMPEMWQPQLFL